MDSSISTGADAVAGLRSPAFVFGCVSHIVSVYGGGGGRPGMLEWAQQLHSGSVFCPEALLRLPSSSNGGVWM